MLKTLLKRFASHLTLMLDNTFHKSLAEELNRIGSVKAKTIVEYGFRSKAEDRELISRTDELNCILLTNDHNTINEKLYPPCHHGGIIIIKDPRWTIESVSLAVKKFARSGSRKFAKHSVTYLHDNFATVHSHNGVERIEF